MATHTLPLLGVSTHLKRNGRLSYAGARLTPHEWAGRLGMSVATLFVRLRCRTRPFKEVVEAALTTPVAGVGTNAKSRQQKIMRLLKRKQVRLTREALVKRHTHWPSEEQRARAKASGADEEITYGGLTLAAYQWALKLNMPVSNLVGRNAIAARPQLMDRYLVQAALPKGVTPV